MKPAPALVSTNRIIAIQLLIIASLLPPPAASQPSTPPPPWISDRPSTYSGSIDPRVGLIVLVTTVAIFFLAFFCLFARSCCVDESSISAARLSTVRRGNRGLDAAVIDSFPTFDYSAVKALKIGKGALECAVCLSEFEDDEPLRLIPKCDHLFHADCIDLWLASHATCPVCRAYLVPDPNAPSQNDDVAISVADVLQPNAAFDQSGGAGTGESMEQPLNPPWLIRSRTRGSLNRWSNTSGRRRWFGLFARSHSTGHVAVDSENTERFTLRVPEEVRRQIISGKLSRTTSCITPAEGSSRKGNRVGFGSSRFDRAALPPI